MKCLVQNHGAVNVIAKVGFTHDSYACSLNTRKYHSGSVKTPDCKKLSQHISARSNIIKSLDAEKHR